jgi:hypothetical protein
MSMFRIFILVNLISWAGHAQQVIPDGPHRLEGYYREMPPVTIDLFFNQPLYSPGDTAFFRAAFLTASESLPIQGSQILTLDIVDHQGQIKLHQSFRVKDGWTGNQLIIPENFPPGIYRVVAYSPWMKNVDPPRFFQTELRVVDTYSPDSDHGTGTLEYYPEGGNLVEGIQSKIIIKSPYRNATHQIVDPTGKVVTVVNTNGSGYGYFFITPAEGSVYMLKSGKLTREIVAHPDGLALQLLPARNSTTSHRLILAVPANSVLRTEELVLMLSGHGSIYYSSLLPLQNRPVLIYEFPSSQLPDGLLLISICKKNGETIASRIFFNPGNRAIVPEIELLPEVGTREEVTVSIQVTDTQRNPVLARVSVSVYHADLLGDFPESIVTRLPSPQNAFIPANAELFTASDYASEPFDQYLITQHWPWYSWKKVLEDIKSPRYVFQTRQQLRGRVVSASTGRVLSDQYRITLLLKEGMDVYEIETEADGQFEADLMIDFFDDTEIYYRIDKHTYKVEDARLQLSHETSQYAATAMTNFSKEQNAYAAYRKQSHIIRNSFRYFDNPVARSITFKNPNASMEDWMNGPDIEIDLDDYLLLPTMQETLHEIVPYLQVRKIRNNEVLRMYLEDLARTGDETPLLMIDGVITDNVSYFLGLKPAEVDKIKLVHSQIKRSKLGALGKDGLVMVETKIQNNASKVPRSSTSTTAKGLTLPLPFPAYQPRPEDKDKRLPVLKPSIFWLPHAQLNPEGKANWKFHTTDDAGRFAVMVEGLTVDGIPFSVRKYFTVKYKPATP